MLQTTLEEYIRLAGLATSAGNYTESEKYGHAMLTALAEHAATGEEFRSFAFRARIIIADALRLQGKHRESLTLANEVYTSAQETGDKSYSSNALRIFGLIAMNTGDIPQARAHFDDALSLADEVNDEFGKAASLGNIGLLHQRSGAFHQAIECFTRAREIAERIENLRLQSLNYNNCGTAYENLSDYPAAMKYYRLAYSVAERNEDTPLMGTILGNMANTSRNTGDYEQALEYNQRALTLVERGSNLDSVSIIFSGLANVYDDMGDYPRALEYHQKALAIDRQRENKQSIASSLMNIGNVYHELGDSAEALAHYHQSLALVEELGNRAGIVRRLANIGNIQYDYGNYAQSLEYFYKALQLAEELHMPSLAATILSNIGEIYGNTELELFDGAKAEEYLLRALSVQTALGVKKGMYGSYKSLATLHEAQNSFEKAYEYFKKFYALEKEVQSKEAKDQAERYAIERKTAEYEKESAVQKEREKILDNILPKSITERLLKGEQPIADYAGSVSIFFSDIVDFTEVTHRIPARELVAGLNEIFKHFDTIALRHGIEKIKTIGDAYMAVCGLPVAREDHAERMANFATEIQEYCRQGATIAGYTLQVRIGLHCGEVIAGVIGDQKFAYDMWGDAVNTASRMESHGEPGKIHVSEEFKHAVETLHATSLHVETLHATSLQFIRRGEMEIKGKGTMKTYFLELQRQE